MMRPFRFAAFISSDLTAGPAEQARQAEDIGFDVVVMGDHIGPELSPMLALAAAASATERIGLGTQVINADLRNPTQLAWDVVAMDRISDGRFELGLGAGHTPQEYAAVGRALQPARDRKRRLMEFVEVMRRLLDGDVVTHHGEHFQIEDAHVGQPVRDRIPIFIGGNGERLFEHAGEHADIVGLQGLGRTLRDGHRHSVNWTVEHLEQQLEQIQRGTTSRSGPIELNALVQVAKVTDDRTAEIAAICDRVDGLSVHDAQQTPYLLIGTVDEIVGQLTRARDRWGISYFTVRDANEFAPVVAALA